jgi:CheY-like chemotaxis protein
VLLVEDEDTVRAVAERALVRQGYEVTTAADGEEGLEAIGRNGPFDLVVSDVVMPSMDGPAMAREIRRLKPDLPVLFMSGYAEEQLRRDIDIPNMHFIAAVLGCADRRGRGKGSARRIKSIIYNGMDDFPAMPGKIFVPILFLWNKVGT